MMKPIFGKIMWKIIMMQQGIFQHMKKTEGEKFQRNFLYERGIDAEFEAYEEYFSKQKGVFAYRPSTIGLRRIRMYQKSDDYSLPQREFQRLVIKIAHNYMSDAKCSQNAFYMLQAAVEDKFIRWGRAAIMVSCGAKKSRVLCREDLWNAKCIAKTM